MKKQILLACVILICFSAHAQYQTEPAQINNSTFMNPIFPGDYPDPSILRDGDDYYVVHSSFEYYPGLLIWHSRDLINWTLGCQCTAQIRGFGVGAGSGEIRWTIECFCLEGPKLIKRGEYYYLTVAEGGTSGPPTGHMVISARSRSPLGPWENSPYNPIARAEDRLDRWWSVGHGTLFKAKDESWWMIFHGYEKDHYNMGRQTLLAPIEWTDDGWYKIPDSIQIDQPIQRPAGQASEQAFSLSDDFSGAILRPHWKFFGEYDTDRFQVANQNLMIKGKGQSVANSSPLLCVPSHHSYMAQVELRITGDAVGGLVLFYNNDACSGILADPNNILANLRGWQFPTETNVIENHAYLRLVNSKQYRRYVLQC
ncbi:MAG: family 43 glycosylhydrolase [candidate division KSB1 bacterium]|nr:family 43 glycosylhydrolase [candidate division KSB1 bacterium]